MQGTNYRHMAHRVLIPEGHYVLSTGHGAHLYLLNWMTIVAQT